MTVRSNWTRACAAGAAVAMAVGPGLAQAQAASPIAAVAGEGERVALQAWIDETRATMASPEFRANLRAAGARSARIYLRHENNQPVYATVPQIEAVLAGRDGNRLVETPITLAFSYQEAGVFPATGWIGTTEADGRQLSAMTLPRINMGRWLSTNVVDQSCAVNTLAHELTHTVASPYHPTQFWYAIADFDRMKTPAGTPAASYLVGAVAQCTWLQRKGRVPATGIATCVSVFGTRHFNSNRCTQFTNDAPIVPRDDLAPEATDEEMGG